MCISCMAAACVGAVVLLSPFTVLPTKRLNDGPLSADSSTTHHDTLSAYHDVEKWLSESSKALSANKVTGPEHTKDSISWAERVKVYADWSKYGFPPLALPQHAIGAVDAAKYADTHICDAAKYYLGKVVKGTTVPSRHRCARHRRWCR